MWRAELCFARARACDVSGATAILDELTTRARSSYVSPNDIALCHAGLNSQVPHWIIWSTRIGSA